MAEVYKKLYQGQPGTSAAIVYTAPSTAGSSVIIKHIRAVNSTETAASIGLFHDGTAAGNRILPNVPLGPGETLIDDSLYTLEPSDTLAAIASVATTITLTIYGIEVS
jgi:hypothetical protein